MSCSLVFVGILHCLNFSGQSAVCILSRLLCHRQRSLRLNLHHQRLSFCNQEHYLRRICHFRSPITTLDIPSCGSSTNLLNTAKINPIWPSTRCHALVKASARMFHVPHVLVRILLMSYVTSLLPWQPLMLALADIICLDSRICHHVYVNHFRHQAYISCLCQPPVNRWIWLSVDCWLFLALTFCSLGSPYPVFWVNFIFVVYFFILCLYMDKKDIFLPCPINAILEGNKN